MYGSHLLVLPTKPPEQQHQQHDRCRCWLHLGAPGSQIWHSAFVSSFHALVHVQCHRISSIFFFKFYPKLFLLAGRWKWGQARSWWTDSKASKTQRWVSRRSHPSVLDISSSLGKLRRQGPSSCDKLEGHLAFCLHAKGLALWVLSTDKLFFVGLPNFSAEKKNDFSPKRAPVSWNSF